MNLFKKLFSKKEEPDDRPIAHQINYNGPAPYQKSFPGTGYGVVFEDDGETGYFYATNETLDNIFDALHLYNVSSKEKVKKGDEIFIVWNPKLLKAGLYYHDEFQAIIDFKNNTACCKKGSPQLNQKWCTSSHQWDEDMTAGLK